MTQSTIRRSAGAALLLLIAASAPAPAALPPDLLGQLRMLHEDATELLTEHYHPQARVDQAFRAGMRAVEAKLAEARSLDDACLLLADAYRAFDPNIRLYQFPRRSRTDYGLDWRVVGNTILVSRLDPDSDAARKIRLGERIFAVEGHPLDRGNHRLYSYALRVIAPRDRLVLEVGTGPTDTRTVTAEARVLPERRLRTAAWNDGGYDVLLEPGEHRQVESYRRLSDQTRRVGRTLVWRAGALTQRTADVSALLRETREAANLVVDLRGVLAFRYDTVLALLDGVLPQHLEIARIEQAGFDTTLAAGGRPVFGGGLVAVVDSTTGGYAEMLAAVLRHTGRGLVLGDRTMGQLVEEALATRIRIRHEAVTRTITVTVTGPNGTPIPMQQQVVEPAHTSVTNVMARLSTAVFDPGRLYHGVRFPVGSVRMLFGDGVHGVGVEPDTRVLPSPADLAGRRDVTLATALQLAGETITPESAGRLFGDPNAGEHLPFDISAWL